MCYEDETSGHSEIPQMTPEDVSAYFCEGVGSAEPFKEGDIEEEDTTGGGSVTVPPADTGGGCG